MVGLLTHNGRFNRFVERSFIGLAEIAFIAIIGTAGINSRLVIHESID